MGIYLRGYCSLGSEKEDGSLDQEDGGGGPEKCSVCKRRRESSNGSGV